MIVYVNVFLAPYNDKRLYFGMDHPTPEAATKAIILNQERFVATIPVEVSTEKYEDALSRVNKEGML